MKQKSHSNIFPEFPDQGHRFCSTGSLTSFSFRSFCPICFFYSFIFFLADPTRPAIITPENPMMIKARDRTPLTITVGNNVTTLTETKITIQCLTSGEPKPNVTWSKDGQKIPEGSKYAVQKDGSLLIREAGKHDSGLYTCTSENIVGNDSASTVIQVVGKTCYHLS